MIESGLAPSSRNGEVHARIVEHPLRVIGLHNSWLSSEQSGVEAYRLREVADGDMHVQALHGGILSGWHLGVLARGFAFGGRCAGRTTAAIIGEEAEQCVHLPELGRVDH